MFISASLHLVTTSSTTDDFDPSVESDGLTLDTPDGPVDLIAIEHAQAGRPVTLTPAELAYLRDGR